MFSHLTFVTASLASSIVFESWLSNCGMEVGLSVSRQATQPQAIVLMPRKHSSQVQQDLKKQDLALAGLDFA